MPKNITTLKNDDAMKYLIAAGVFDAAGGLKVNVRAKTADYTILPANDPSFTIFTNRGAAGAVNFTLPAPSGALEGVVYFFLGVADQNILVVAATVDTLLALNDVAADSVAMSTAGGKIGGLMIALCDGTAWAVVGAAVGGTFTVAT